LFVYYTESYFELEKVGRDFTLLPRTFMGAIIEKFCGGALGGKGWPAGTIQVAERHGEFSFLGLEAIARCCKYRSYLNNSFMADQMKKDLCEGGVCYFSYLLNCGYKSFIWCVCVEQL